jgi:hypothetical protein
MPESVVSCPMRIVKLKGLIFKPIMYDLDRTQARQVFSRRNESEKKLC